MQTSPHTHFVSQVDAYNFVLQCLSFCGLASTPQLARVYAHRKEPTKRISSVLGYLAERGYIESRRGFHNEPNLYRLTAKIRNKYGVRGIRWDRRIEHKLALTETYLDLDCPPYFYREYRQTFRWMNQTLILAPDAVCKVGDRYLYLEVQRTSIESVRWAEKRRNYERYFATGAWVETFQSKPEVLVVQYANQLESTIGIASNYTLHVISAEEVAQFGVYLRAREDDTICGQGSRQEQMGKGDAEERADLWR